MNIILGKDFKKDLGHMPRKGCVPSKEYFKKATSISVEESKLIVKYNIMDEDRDEFLDYVRGNLVINKPEAHTGLWVSPIINGTVEWANIIDGLSLSGRHDDEYYIIKPTEDCRILVLDNEDTYNEFEDKYNMNYDKMAKDIDLLYLENLELCSPSFKDRRLGKYTLRMHGWDCESGVFLNDKFTIGKRVEIK